MSQVAEPSPSLTSFELTQDEIDHVATSLASDLEYIDGLMPAYYVQMHQLLLARFLSKLPECNQVWILKGISFRGVLQ